MTCSSEGRIPLDGRGDVLPEDADPVWLDRDPADLLAGSALNSRGEPFSTPAGHAPLCPVAAAS